MIIHKLPNHLINKLKAWEIVERPYSVLKELVENSLDAGATVISIDVHDGGTSLIKVSDNGTGISGDDLALVLERYATSKISNELDLEHIDSYGFRGEALASISEVSKLTLQTKIKDWPIWHELSNCTWDITISSIPFLQPHGTTMIVENLFYNTPVRLKFLKSSQTEYMYLYQLFIDVALIHWDKTWIFKKQGNIVFDLNPAKSLTERFGLLFKQQRIPHIKTIHYQEEGIHVSWIIGDSTLSFGSADNIKIYVNDRPVQDRIIKKALLSAYDRQIKPGEYPLGILMINLDPAHVDVNVHPRKTEVRFINPGWMYQLVVYVIRQTLSWSKIIAGEHHISSQSYTSTQHSWSTKSSSNRNNHQWSQYIAQQATNIQNSTPQYDVTLFGDSVEDLSTNGMHVVGQIWDSYILATDHTGLYYIDQHALAERIGFEQLKQQRKPDWQSSHRLLQPIKITLWRNKDVSWALAQCQSVWFDIDLLSEETVVVQWVPEVFSRYPIDLERLFNVILYLEDISYDLILDQLRATKACKAAIKAGDRLSLSQMQQLINDGLSNIEGMFVCQHGRPFFIHIPRGQIDKMFDR